MGSGRTDIAQLRRQGVEVSKVVDTPEIAVSGDTTFDAIEVRPLCACASSVAACNVHGCGGSKGL